jgi:hypothetical protein
VRGKLIKAIGLTAAALFLAVAWTGGAAPPARPTSAPNPSPPPKKPADNLSYWLGQAATAPTRPAAEPNTAEGTGKNPFATDENFRRQDVLPGVIELSDGQVLAGYMYTTAEKDWLVWVEAEKRWRRVPFLAVLSISAVVLEEKMEQVWRWKEMGVPERVYTGEEYPTRKLDWRFHLIDDSTITGTVKGQPVWIEQDGKKHGPYILNEQVRGPNGQKLKDLITVKQIIVSRRMMNEVLGQTSVPGASSRPAGRQ